MKMRVGMNEGREWRKARMREKLQGEILIHIWKSQATPRQVGLGSSKLF